MQINLESQSSAAFFFFDYTEILYYLFSAQERVQLSDANYFRIMLISERTYFLIRTTLHFSYYGASNMHLYKLMYPVSSNTLLNRSALYATSYFAMVKRMSNVFAHANVANR
jgi:hypothetical protein